jgi:HEPN domain-containing protein
MWEQANLDLNNAAELTRNQPEISCLQSVQAAINALSAVLEAQGFFQLPAYSSVELLDLCVRDLAPELEKVRSACYVLDSSMERDVFGNAQQKNIRFTTPYAKTCHQSAKQVCDAVRAYVESSGALVG